MAAINDLINQIDNQELRERIAQEVDRMNRQKKFGLVFEEHLPECTPLYDVPVRKGSTAALKAGKVSDTFVVLKVENGKALCLPKAGGESAAFDVDDLVAVAEFGEPIYPYLKPIDTICNAPDSDLWHTLIEADNYHALQLLEYLYAGKVDCIYIDPPYNTGARDWKYNNDYVDGADAYRHSKWLSMMQKRLKMAKRLLNPKDSVLIVTIDEKEYLHLGCLLEEMFPEASIQMISSVINPAGVSRGYNFARTDEYIFFVQFGNSSVQRLPLADEWRINAADTRTTHMLWSMLIRTGTNVLRSDRPNLFYPIFVYADGSRIHSIGTPYFGTDIGEITAPDGTVAIWPIRSNGDEGNWQISPEGLKGLVEEGFVRLGRFSDRGMAISYLKKGEIGKVKSGIYKITGHRSDGSVISDNEVRAIIPGTQWRIASHDASRNGSNLLKKIIGSGRFSFPKSLYATHDALMFFVSNKQNALIIDFFAGSGTTLHAVNLLNAEDGGHRRCIMVTNNEVSDDEAKALTVQGYHPGDPQWEKLGIAHNVTWPRTVCSIKGCDVKGEPLKGEYIGSEIPMADGFKANAAFFKLSFLDKTSVALGRQFKEMLPTLWMKAGAYGPCPSLKGDKIPAMLVLGENRFAVLADESSFADFEAEVNSRPEIETVYIITDYEAGYSAMVKNLSAPHPYQLYRDYLDNFRINTGRN